MIAGLIIGLLAGAMLGFWVAALMLASEGDDDE